LLAVRDELAAAGRDLYLLDVTHDLEIPVYVAVTPTRNGSELYFASAAHPDSRTAAKRAIGELTQLLHWSSRLRLHDDLCTWLSTATLENQSYFKPRGMTSALICDPDWTVEEQIHACVDRIESAGVEAFYVDLTRPEIGVPVVRVIAPGLRYFCARLGPGRLYEVPIRMGWLSKPNREEDLNPIPCMI
jgi:ribosomal protein S12 methylthiotransferase accessory factor